MCIRTWVLDITLHRQTKCLAKIFAVGLTATHAGASFHNHFSKSTTRAIPQVAVVDVEVRLIGYVFERVCHNLVPVI
jgi:uncharacterized membrane protein